MDITGTDRNDNLTDTDANDRIFGLGGDDFIITLVGNDIAYGGDGNDIIVDNAGGVPNNNNVFYGEKGNDFLDGSDGDDQLYGGKGNDTLSGKEGDDLLDGGSGTDLADYSRFLTSERVGLTVDLTRGTARGFAGNDTLISIENIQGTTSNDTLIGNAKDNVLYGDPEPFIEDFPPPGGDDNLNGRDGNDTLVGGFGRDTLTGGSGSDTFIFNYAEEGIDRITDFSSANDTIQVVRADGPFDRRFSGELQLGAITDDQFFLGAAAHDSSDRFIYNRSSGALYFDPDGTGSNAQIQLATLDNNALLSANDIVVI
jgi:Ca2+-binding RTX toxin-like protein